jgi:hypothetical protein
MVVATLSVMAVPGTAIHAFCAFAHGGEAWMTGPSPVMTSERGESPPQP